MGKRSLASIWARSLQRSWKAAARSGLRAAKRSAKTLVPAAKRAVVKPAPALAKPRPAARRAVPAGGGDMVAGVAATATGARRYLLFRPPGVVLRERLPLLVMLHGCTQDAAQFALSTRMNRLAARQRFFVLYPEQDKHANPHRCWNWFGTASGAAQGETAILAAAVEQACTLYPVDRARIAVAGLSAGAGMAALLATRAPSLFKAVVMHSGVAPGSAHSAMSALGAMRGRRPVDALPDVPADGSALLPPLLVIQGTLDPTVAPANGRQAAQAWADALGARAGTARSVRRGQRRATLVTDFKRGGRTLVSLCEVAGLGHAWSGGDARQPFGDATGPDASRMVWAFALRQFARAKG